MAVVDAASAAGAEVYGGLSIPILQIQMSDAVRLDVVTVLMSHANVDFIEANRPSGGGFDRR